MTEITSEHMDFGTFEEFLEWKNNMEANSRSRFIQKTGKFSTKDNNKTVIKYFCHRSGNFFSKGKGLRHLKTQGSNKMNSFCPASLKIEIGKDKCKVIFINKHVGHEIDLGHLSLTLAERESLHSDKLCVLKCTTNHNKIINLVHIIQLIKIIYYINVSY